MTNCPILEKKPLENSSEFLRSVKSRIEIRKGYTRLSAMSSHLLWLVNVLSLTVTSLNFCECVKLPSWRGPKTFFEGRLPSSRHSHGLAACDDGRIYAFGGETEQGELCQDDVIATFNFNFCFERATTTQFAYIA